MVVRQSVLGISWNIALILCVSRGEKVKGVPRSISWIVWNWGGIYAIKTTLEFRYILHSSTGALQIDIHI